MPVLFVAGSILIPIVLGIQVWLVPSKTLQQAAIFVNSVVLLFFSLDLVQLAPFRGQLAGALAESVNLLFAAIDVFLLGYMAYLGWRWRKYLVLILSLLQLLVLLWLELAIPGEVIDHILVDRLSLTLYLIVSFVGSLVIIFASKYMDDHKAEGGRPSHGLPRFFGVLLIFTGTMNGLVSTDNLRWLYLFWEVTTLASFLLIFHYKHAEARENAFRALWMNQIGGLAILLALVLMGRTLETASLSELVRYAPASSQLTLAVALLLLAAFTKAAQVPFHGWLLGAMVAPTPVSALLHSSTMVNAALYLAFRLSPAFRGTTLGTIVALVGAFSYFATSGMGIGEANAKRVLAFSTIANLGLALTMSALNNSLALTAGMLILVYHAVSKGLLFLAVGTVEHKIGSRNIEKMDRLFEELPVTTVLAVLGMISMMMPPFGVLIGKWLAIEAAVNNPVILLFVIFGSAFTVVFWSKWVGKMLATTARPPEAPRIHAESLSFLTAGPLFALAALAIFTSLFLGWTYSFFARPVVGAQYPTLPLEVRFGGLYSSVGGFLPWPLFAILLLVLASIPVTIGRMRCQDICLPYLCGENSEDEPEKSFYSARDEAFPAGVGGYYAEGIFGEGAINRWAVPVGIGLLLLMLGVVL
ncbi:MAG: NADH-quinone oxidoreductase subunit L [Firmicutes bacterium]|nr:NADH-quinone oxidoreductase subunit L [Bacillota bacterium]